MVDVGGVVAASQLAAPPRAPAIARHPPAIMRRTSSEVAGEGRFVPALKYPLYQVSLAVSLWYAAVRRGIRRWR
mgnify:CR=1 FL=1